jgi:hypothetical protein
MAIGKDVDAASDLKTLQDIVNQSEPGIGLLDGIETVAQGNKNFTRLTFDDGGMVVDKPMTILELTTDPAPPRQILFLQGRSFVDGQDQVLSAYVPSDHGFLVKRTVSFLASKGLTEAQSIGIAANIEGESSFDPTRPGDGGTAYGLCQWRGDRQTNFQKVFDRPIKGSTFRDQLEFINWELNNTESAAGKALKQAQSVGQAADIVCRDYERPLHPELDSPKRVATATQLQATFFA